MDYMHGPYLFGKTHLESVQKYSVSDKTARARAEFTTEFSDRLLVIVILIGKIHIAPVLSRQIMITFTFNLFK